MQICRAAAGTRWVIIAGMRARTVLCVAIFASALTLSAQDKLPEGAGKASMLKVCHGCHPPDIAAAKHHTRDEWEQVVVNMINAGATGTDDEFSDVVEYLSKYFPKAVNVNQAEAVVLGSALAITPKEAAAIVAYREKNGSFKALEDLKKVPDLDYAKVEAKKDRIQF
jgi:competence protein ComEA